MSEELYGKFGWRVTGEKKTQGQDKKLRLPPVNRCLAAAEHRRPQRANFMSTLLNVSRIPVLLGQDIKIVMQPRGGLNVEQVSRLEISRAMVAAANVSGEQATQNVNRPNKQQNIVFFTTPERANADR